VAKVFFCWIRKVAVGLIAALDAMRGAVREAILREEVRDEAIVGGYLCKMVCRCVEISELLTLTREERRKA
jgi:small basic protein